MPAHDHAIAHLHDRHERMHDVFAGVEDPLLHVLGHHEVTVGDRVPRMVVVAGERLDAEPQPGDDLGGSGRADAVDTDVGVVRVGR